MGKRVIRLTESDIQKIVERVISEQGMMPLKYKAQGALDKASEFFKNDKTGKAVEGSDNDLTTLVTLLPTKPTALDQKTHPRKGVLPPANKIYSISTSNNGDFDFFQFKPGGYFNTHNWVVQTQGGKSRLGTFDVNGKKIYFKKFGIPQNQWYKDEGFTEVVDLGSLAGKSGGTTAYDLIKPVLPDVLSVNYAGIPGSAKGTFATSIVYYIIDPKTGAKRYNQFEKDNKTLTAKGTWKIQDNSIFYEPDDKTKKPPTDSVKGIGGVRVAPTEDFVKTGRAFVESTMSGELVRKIQQALINQGYLKISKATNYFGPKTDAAVRAFQKAKGLKVDGKVGKNTYSALFAPATPAEPERQFPEEITNIKPKGLANVTQGIQTPPPITRQGNIQTANY